MAPHNMTDEELVIQALGSGDLLVLELAQRFEARVATPDSEEVSILQHHIAQLRMQNVRYREAIRLAVNLLSTPAGPTESAVRDKCAVVIAVLERP